MGFTYVQGTGIASPPAALSQSVNLIGVTAGDMIIINAQVYNAGGNSFPIISASDTQGNVYTLDKSGSNIFFGVTATTNAIFRAIALSTGNVTFIVATSIAGSITFSVDEFLVSDPVTVDATTAATGNSNTPNAGAMTLSGTDLIVFGTFVHASLQTYTAGTGFALGYTNNSFPSSIVTQYDTAYSAMYASPACTSSTSAAWSAVAVAYIILLINHVYSADQAFGSEPLGGLLTLNDSDIPTTQDNFSESFHLYTTDNSFELESNFISSSFIFTDSFYSSENNLTFLYDLSNDNAVGSENQYVAASIMDAYLYSADSASSQEGIMVFSSLLTIELSQAFEANYLSTTTVSTFSANTDVAYSGDRQAIFILGSDISSTQDIQMSGIFPLTPSFLEGGDLTTGSENTSLFSLIPSTESPLEYEVNYISSLFYFTDQGFQFSHQLQYKSDYDYGQEYESFYESILNYQSLLSIDVYNLSNSVYGTESSVALESSYLAATIQPNTEQAGELESSWLSRLPFGQSASEFELSLQSVIGIDPGFYTSVPMRIMLPTESAISIDQYFLSNSMITSASSITEFALSGDSFLLNLLPLDEYVLEYESSIYMNIGSDLAESVIAHDTQFVMNYIILIDQAIAIA